MEVRKITESKKVSKSERKSSQKGELLKNIYSSNLRDLLNICYQCARCSGVCQISKVQYFRPSRIIQKILEGFEEEILKSGILWDCLMCNQCLAHCPENINFADIVRNAKYIMRNEYQHSSGDYIAHKGVYTSIAELMSKLEVKPKRDMSWIPKECEVSDSGEILYHIGCIPFYNFEFEELNNIPPTTLRLLYKVEEQPIVVLENEYCCGHDLYWGEGKMEEFISLAQKNIHNFEKAGISKIITTCAEGYRTFKIDYPKIFEDFNAKFEVQHIIEYIYENWKAGNLEFETDDVPKEQISFTFHDPCRLSRFLPKSNTIMMKAREMFLYLKKMGYHFNEMEHNKENSLCCGVSSWMNCNERSKALRYKRLKEAKDAGDIMVTTCPKCILHFNCLQNDYEEIASIKIQDFTEFLIKLIKIDKNQNTNGKLKAEVK
ncbi:MAG: CoB--CoM heterodisulfide reductase iron-sulfur subunit D [Promethearchaeota archaeon]|nr:MAG: CoB--CoM heterodisulfide reductase iron-sulfur subunit D [Candidatus Lokiarchaeota archaeon]